MLIRDKQELRRCVKQTVRRASVTEPAFSCDEAFWGVDVLLTGIREGRTPFDEQALARYAALDALGLPTDDRQKARLIAEGYVRDAWMRELLDAMHARRALVMTPMDRPVVPNIDSRVGAILVVRGKETFVRGRWGVDYAAAAETIMERLSAVGARDLMAVDCSLRDFEDCLLPISEETGCVLHLRFHSEEMEPFAQLMERFPKARAVVAAPSSLEPRLIDLCAENPRMLFLLGDEAYLATALRKLGTNMQVFSSHADSAELMLGRWVCRKERLWQALAESYLPAARSGYALTSEQIEKDVEALLGGALEAMY